jgi:hypothetical protein
MLGNEAAQCKEGELVVFLFPKPIPLLDEMHQLQAGHMRLNQMAVARWGTEDPLPGKWHT